MTFPGTEITNLIFSNDDVTRASSKYSKDNVAAGTNNVPLAAYVTTQARLKLYEYLSKIGQSVLYCDTDPVIFTQNDYDPPNVKTGDYLDDLTDELVEFFLPSLSKNVYRVALKSMPFLYFPLDRKTCNKV